ncbi:dihydroflavonol 4-reductase isoform X2 [Cryptomeria japonica]|nr:dihydroflavonol 4-reductase isoform X2 [Cryptomeria japonica]
MMAEETCNEVKGTVCVTGAAGFIGSWLTMRLLELGYVVRATVRDPGNPNKTSHLLKLPGAYERLTLWKADLDDEGSFDNAIDGCEGVFHAATAMDFESEDPENEVIQPTVNGILNVMRSCAKAKSVKRVLFTTSAGAVNFTDDFGTPGKIYDETCWTNVELCRSLKMTGWMYFVSKTLGERAACEFAEKNNVDFISVIPTLVVGPFIMQTMPPSLVTALALLTRNEPHYMILRQVQLVHLDDLCMSLIFLYEHPQSKGRYISSSHDVTIVQLAKMLAQKYPQYNIPTEFKDADDSLPVVPYSSKKLVDMGFKFKYTIDDMFDGAIQSCVEKGLLPKMGIEAESDIFNNNE